MLFRSIVLDVKAGAGAFMKTVAEAVELSELMVSIGGRMGRRMVALISDMNQPLGHAVGNALEVIEAIETLNGRGPADFRDHCLEVAGHMLRLAGAADDLPQAKQLAAAALEDGSALAKFRTLVEAQGGDPAYVDAPERFQIARNSTTVEAPVSGFLESINAAEIGRTCVALGGGRQVKGETIDHSVGLLVFGNVGDPVSKGDELCTIFAGSQEGLAEAEARVLEAITIGEQPVTPLPLFHKMIEN